MHQIKASERPSGRKKVIFKKKIGVFKEAQIPTELDLKHFCIWHQRCKSNPISMRDEVKAQLNWHSEVSLGKWIRMSLTGS